MTETRSGIRGIIIYLGGVPVSAVCCTCSLPLFFTHDLEFLRIIYIIYIYIYIYIYIFQLNWICNFIVSLVFPYMNAYLGPYSFFPFAVVLACTFLFALFVLPETQGKTPEEMVALVRTQSQSMSVYEINEDDTSDAINLEWKKAMDELMKEEQQKMNDGSYGTFLLLCSILFLSLWIFCIVCLYHLYC